MGGGTVIRSWIYIFDDPHCSVNIGDGKELNLGSCALSQVWGAQVLFPSCCHLCEHFFNSNWSILTKISKNHQYTPERAQSWKVLNLFIKDAVDIPHFPLLICSFPACTEAPSQLWVVLQWINSLWIRETGNEAAPSPELVLDVPQVPELFIPHILTPRVPHTASSSRIPSFPDSKTCSTVENWDWTG